MPITTFGEDCKAYIGTCEYYLCRENSKPCSSNGYYIGFGYKYCKASFGPLINNVSKEGSDWLVQTATCLQRQMDQISESNSCNDIKNKAIQGHDICYQEANFCALKLADKIKILATISPAVLESGVLNEGIQVLRYCLKADH